MSPDNFVQDPYNTQNFDRYSYVYNNPLIYTDPSGEEITLGAAVIIAVAVAILGNGINNLINGTPFWYGMDKSATMSAAMAVVSFGIGSVTSTITSTVGKAVVQAGMHGMSGGIMSSLDGGEFGSGFAAGAVSSLISSGVEFIGDIGTKKGFTFNMINETTNVTNQQIITIEGPLRSFNSDLFKAINIVAGGLSGGISSTITPASFELTQFMV